MSNDVEDDVEEDIEEDIDEGENGEEEDAEIDEEIQIEDEKLADLDDDEDDVDKALMARVKAREQAKKEKEEKRKKEKEMVPPPGFVWLNLLNPKAPKQLQSRKVLVSLEATNQEIRMISHKKLGCPMKELHMEVDGKAFWIAKEKKFTDCQKPCVNVQWSKMERLKALVKFKKTGGVSGQKGYHKRTALHFACIFGDYDLVKEVLTHEEWDPPMINATDRFGDSALTFAAISGASNIVDVLISKKADIHNVAFKKRNAIMLACEHGYEDIVQSLLMANASLDPIPGTTFPTPLHLAKLNQRDACVWVIEDATNEDDSEDDLFDM
eukprot:TRINITY_DN70881_c0_g1_i1.p1 TRINITY_DN70881_c0_g1~~TRINITY_DN70881_c0_g1_i1.p1  ORF type:complete len:335 (-),score=79.07 TRINITY_DN70881_c0_g1_i1:79-1053(-)